MVMRKQCNVYLPPELIKEIKLAALRSDQSLSDFVEEALIERVQDHRQGRSEEEKNQ